MPHQDKEFADQIKTFAQDVVTFLNSLAPKNDPFTFDKEWFSRPRNDDPYYPIRNKSNTFAINIEGITRTSANQWLLQCRILIGYTVSKETKIGNEFVISKKESYTQKELEQAENNVFALLKDSYEKNWKSGYLQATQENFTKDVERLAEEAVMLLNKLAGKKDSFKIKKTGSNYYLTSTSRRFTFAISGAVHGFGNKGWILRLLSDDLNKASAEQEIVVSTNMAYTTKEFKTAREAFLHLLQDAYKNAYLAAEVR